MSDGTANPMASASDGRSSGRDLEPEALAACEKSTPIARSSGQNRSSFGGLHDGRRSVCGRPRDRRVVRECRRHVEESQGASGGDHAHAGAFCRRRLDDGPIEANLGSSADGFECLFLGLRRHRQHVRSTDRVRDEVRGDCSPAEPDRSEALSPLDGGRLGGPRRHHGMPAPRTARPRRQPPAP